MTMDIKVRCWIIEFIAIYFQVPKDKANFRKTFTQVLFLLCVEWTQRGGSVEKASELIITVE